MLISPTQAASVSLIFYECIVTYAIRFIILEIMYNSYVRRINICHMIITTCNLEHKNLWLFVSFFCFCVCFVSWIRQVVTHSPS